MPTWIAARPVLAGVAFLTLAVTAVGCSTRIRLVHGMPVSFGQSSVRLHGHSLSIHLSSGLRAHAAGPLLVYATGDAGWWGKDKGLFEVLAEWGYPVAGFSARDYVHHLGPGSEVERPIQLADDYAAIIAAAEASLELPPTTKIVLVGKSRGAGLEVAAAATRRLRPTLQGVLAVALTREEEYIERRLRGASRRRAVVMLQTYDVLPQVGSVPVAVIQSSGDQYLPAAQARVLFGAETAVRHFSEITARDHNFSGALPGLYQEMAHSFGWILDR